MEISDSELNEPLAQSSWIVDNETATVQIGSVIRASPSQMETTEKANGKSSDAVIDQLWKVTAHPSDLGINSDYHQDSVTEIRTPRRGIRKIRR